MKWTRQTRKNKNITLLFLHRNLFFVLESLYLSVVPFYAITKHFPRQSRGVCVFLYERARALSSGFIFEFELINVTSNKTRVRKSLSNRGGEKKRARFLYNATRFFECHCLLLPFFLLLFLLQPVRGPVIIIPPALFSSTTNARGVSKARRS